VKELRTRVDDTEQISPETLSDLVELVARKIVTAAGGRTVLDKLVSEGGTPAGIVEREGLAAMEDSGELEAIVAKVIDDNPDIVERIRGGNAKAMGALVGPIMRETKVGPLSGRPRSTRQEMEVELHLIRERGYARYYDPRYDIAGIASPIFGSDREILGCLGVTMPSKRYQLHLEDDLTLAVREAAATLSELAAIAHS